VKVVYRSIFKEIQEAKEEAARHGRTIEHIEISSSEYAELMRELGPLYYLEMRTRASSGDVEHILTVDGVRIRCPALGYK
jgi:hypothetical protein